MFRGYGETRRTERSGDRGDATEMSTTNQPPPTVERVQGDFLRDYEQKFANLPVHLKLAKLCSNAGLANTAEKGLYFATRDDAELDKLKGSCREYT